MKSARFIAGAFALWAFHAAATPRLAIRDAATASPVAGATIVFVGETRPGPYPSATSDANGICELRPDAAEIVVVHPAYLPQKLRLNPSTFEVLLEAGQPVENAIPARSSLRIYLASWIGHYDVEQLPPISSSGKLRCGGEDVVFDISSPGLPRSIARGSFPNLRGGTVTSLAVHVREGPKGVVYIASAASHGTDPIVARSRLLDAQGMATFDDLAIQDHVSVIAAAEGYAPTLASARVSVGKRIEIAPLPHLTASAHIQCDPRFDGIAARATFAPREFPALEIDRDVSVDREGNVRVLDGGSGVVKIVLSASGRRDATRAVQLSGARPAADAGGLCPGLPFAVRGSVAGENGRPMSGAVVRYGKSSVTSSKSGKFDFMVTAPDAGTLSVTAPGYLRWQRWLEPSDVPMALTVRLSKGLRYQIRVTDHRSRLAVPKYRLRCYSAGEGPKLAFQREIASSDGRYTTPALRDDLSRVVIEAEGYEASTREVASRTTTREGKSLCDLGTVDLKPMSRIGGRVLDGDARPVKDALVRVRAAQLPEWDSGTSGFSLFETRSHADGTFELPVASGTYMVAAGADGFAPTERTVTVNDTLDIGDLELHEGLSTRVHVVTHSGVPVAGIQVELHRGSADDKRDVRVEIADDDGNARFRHLSAGAYTVVARRDRRLAAKPILLDDAGEQEAELEIGSTVVRGFATEGGRPRGDSKLALLPTETLSSPGLTVIRQQTGSDGRTQTMEVLGKAAAANVTQTDSTGFFTFTDVAPGQYVLTLQDGTGSRSRSLGIPDVDTVDGSTDFGGTPIEGLVTDSQTGTGLGAAVVLLENAQNEPLASTMSDAGGHFEFLSDGEGVVIQASHDGYKTGSAAVADRGAFLTVPLTKGSLALRGAVLHGGVAESRAVVAWQSDGVGPMRGGSVNTDADGTFEIDGLAPGGLTVAVAAPGFGIQFQRIDVAETALNQALVEVQPGSSLHLELPKGVVPQQIDFQTLGTDITQMLWRLPNGAPILTGEGEWTWRSLAPATYQVVAGRQGRSVVLKAGEDARLSFRSVP